MNAYSSDRKAFQVTDNDQLLGELVYQTPFYLKSEIQLPGTEPYKLAPSGFFGTSVVVTQNGHKVASLAMSWGGQIIISFEDGRDYLLKLTGLFQNKLILENKSQATLIQYEPKFNWRDFYNKYDITYGIANNESRDTLLLFLGLYAVNYFIATISGANAGIM